MVRSQEVTFVGEYEPMRTILVKQADGSLRPEQAIKEGWIDVQLGSDCLSLLRFVLVEVIKYA